ncbi:MAG: serine protease [Chloroflexi bacterium]|nr:serine protease [Chloroflexota bacterium]
MFANRKALYQELEMRRDSKVICYVTGDRRQLETQIHSEVLDFLVQHLDTIGIVERVSLVLYTRGGNTLASWSVANLIRQFCDKFEVIIPMKAHSGGTLIALGADKIVMTKQATLGPIDPSVNTPLNPVPQGGPGISRVPVSVEAVNGFIEFVKSAGVSKKEMCSVLEELSKQVHPLVLGEAFRARSQIRMLAQKLLSRQIDDESKIKRILAFLCSESGSHDYTINRREARNELGLVVETPDQSLYELIKAIYDDIAKELQLTSPYSPDMILGTNNKASYAFRRALVESAAGGCHVFVSEGELTKQPVQVRPGVTQVAIQDNRTFEGWRHDVQ